MGALSAPYLAAALLLVVAGAAKTVRPLTLVRALRTAGLAVRAPVLARWVRVLAAAEAVLGVTAVCAPSRLLAVGVAVSYAGFTVFVLRALRRASPLASCGCFGSSDTPPTPGHAAVTALLAVAAGATAGSAGGPRSATTFGVAAVLAYVLYVALAVLPLASQRALR